MHSLIDLIAQNAKMDVRPKPIARIALYVRMELLKQKKEKVIVPSVPMELRM
jgi:hypothetical protein